MEETLRWRKERWRVFHGRHSGACKKGMSHEVISSFIVLPSSALLKPHSFPPKGLFTLVVSNKIPQMQRFSQCIILSVFNIHSFARYFLPKPLSLSLKGSNGGLPLGPKDLVFCHLICKRDTRRPWSRCYEQNMQATLFPQLLWRQNGAKENACSHIKFDFKNICRLQYKYHI